MKKRNMLIVALAAALCFAAPMTSKAAAPAEAGTWQSNATGYWYEVGDSYLTSGFYDITDANGETATYYFDARGYMATGWAKLDRHWYYFGSNGKMATGWQNIGGTWYYLESDGKMLSETTHTIYNGVDDEVGKTYVFAESGAMYTGWAYVNSSWYYCDASGAAQTGWQYIGGKWYYFRTYGSMYSRGRYTINGKTYIFAPSGEMVTGWYNMGDAYDTYPTWAYCNADGTVATGWILSGSNWYYVEDGYMATSEWFNLYTAADGSRYYGQYPENDGDTWVTSYYVGRDGVMVKGWYNNSYSSDYGEYEVNWVYTNPIDGTFYTGWVASGGKWYYINKQGNMVRGGLCTIGTAPKAPVWEDYTPADYDWTYEEYKKAWDTYQADLDDYYAAYETYRENNTYVFDVNGVMLGAGWYSISNTYGTTWFYANANGTGYNGWLISGGKYYYIDCGIMLANTTTPDGYWVRGDGVWR